MNYTAGCECSSRNIGTQDNLWSGVQGMIVCYVQDGTGFRLYWTERIVTYAQLIRKGDSCDAKSIDTQFIVEGLFSAEPSPVKKKQLKKTVRIITRIKTELSLFRIVGQKYVLWYFIIAVNNIYYYSFIYLLSFNAAIRPPHRITDSNLFFFRFMGFLVKNPCDLKSRKSDFGFSQKNNTGVILSARTSDNYMSSLHACYPPLKRVLTSMANRISSWR